MKNKLSHEAIFMVGGDFTSDGLKFLKQGKRDFQRDGKSIKIIATSIASRALSKQKPFVIHVLAENEDSLNSAWRNYMNRVNLIGSFEKMAKIPIGFRWMSWSNMIQNSWARESILVTWSRRIDPWLSTPLKLRYDVQPFTESLSGMTLGSLISKAGPGLRLVKT